MKTSYFAKSLKDPKAVSIAAGNPPWYQGKQYSKLAPPYDLLMKFKNDKDEKTYTEAYKKIVLDKLDPKQVYQELGEDAILLCWEKSGKFCHRYIVAKWLSESLNITINEIV